ncbi:ankyrin repeat domain-containing protein 6b isoform X2 [Clinocottus analis]|uniref:ankyrin repeat domain-containing protein 6b isoform X2 n=1 Tax=Clinocottus analis TaxID=304258 RepID=UPI0035C0DAC0
MAAAPSTWPPTEVTSRSCVSCSKPAATWTSRTTLMTSSGLEWDALDCPLVGFPSARESFPSDSEKPDGWRCQIHSLWSMSSATGPSASSRTGGGCRRCRLSQQEEEEEEEEERRQWRRAGKEPGGSGRVKEGEQTALQRAAVVGNSDVIGALIQEGCALDRQDKDGNTALHEASWHGFSQSVKVLVKAGANAHAKNKAGNTALHLACQNGHAQSCKVLLLGGSRPDHKNHAGDSCLHVASRYNHVAVIRILLGAFCSVSEKNLAGDTPLHVAAALNHKKTVRLLLEAGADSHVCNSAGQTALDQAREHNNPDVALLLTKAPQVQSFVRGRSARKRREKLKAEGRAQSVPRDEMLPQKDSAADDTQSSDRAACKHGKEVTAGKTERKQKQKPSLSEPLRRRDAAAHRRKCKPRGADVPPHNYKAYQLYTLYRGKDGKVMQAPLNGCRCEPLISKLENQLEATKEEMKTEIHTVQDLMNSKMGQLDRKNKHQIRALDKLTVERVSAERTECLQRIEQRAAQERLEAEKRQASLVGELKSWCLSKLHNMDPRLTGESGAVKPPRRSSSVSESLNEADGDGGGFTALPSGSQCPELHGGGATLDSSRGEAGSANHYFVVHVESSPDGDKAHGAAPAAARSPLPSLQVVRPKERPAICADTQREDRDQNRAPRDVDPDPGGARGGRSCRSGSLSPAAERRRCSRTEAGFKERGRDRGKAQRKPGRTKSRGAAGGARTLEVFGDRPGGPSFAQERDNMHAQEVTQYFFEAVSAQMERWYERKVQEARWQADQRAQEDRTALMERITHLEEELSTLRTGRHDGC